MTSHAIASTVGQRVVHLSAVRAEQGLSRPGWRTWMTSVEICCAYASKIRAEHDAESAAIHFDALLRGLRNWSEAEDLSERTTANNETWELYRSAIWHLASLPAPDRRRASMKRSTIGKQWLRLGEGDEDTCYARLHEGCAQDDHLFPPSERMSRRTTAT